MEDDAFLMWLTGELSELPGVQAVALGGSRAKGEHRPDSDWDLALYYRGAFDPDCVRAKGWDGQVSDIGGWGGGVMNGGAWLTIEDRRVDIHYRDLDEVEQRCHEAEAGRFTKELLLFYAAGIPSYVLMAELALNVVLAGELPKPSYPDLLSRTAEQRWSNDAIASLGYAYAALRTRGDVGVGLAQAGRGLIEKAHAVLAARKEWVTNEKGIVERAGLNDPAARLLAASDVKELTEVVGSLHAECGG